MNLSKLLLKNKKTFFKDKKRQGTWIDSVKHLEHSATFDDLHRCVNNKNINKKVLKRDNPGTFYKMLLEKYKDIHRYSTQLIGTDEILFNGSIMRLYFIQLERLIRDTESNSLLDYGSGKGEMELEYIKNKLNLSSIGSYEPGLEKKANLPVDKADIVTCFDVLEHVHIADLFWVIEELFSRAKKIVFCSVSTRLAIAQFVDGGQVHITVNPPAWWRGVFDSTSSKYPGVQWVLVTEGPNSDGFQVFDWFTNRDLDKLHCFYDDK